MKKICILFYNGMVSEKSPALGAKACLAGQPSHVILTLHSHATPKTLHTEGLGFNHGEVTL
jgi:hypothetical protein